MKLQQRQELAQRRAGRNENFNNTHIHYELNSEQRLEAFRITGINNAIGIAIPMYPEKDNAYIITIDMNTQDISKEQLDVI